MIGGALGGKIGLRLTKNERKSAGSAIGKHCENGAAGAQELAELAYGGDWATGKIVKKEKPQRMQ